MPAFEVIPSHQPTAAIILDVPHSGEDYSLIKSLNPAITHILPTMCDIAVDKIWELAPLVGATIIKATFPKAFVDLNRSLGDVQIWPGLEDWPYSIKQKTCYSHYDRLFKSGAYDREVGDFICLEKNELSLSDAMHRVEQYYLPYRENLKDLVDQAHTDNGYAVHISCHSMRCNPPGCPGDLYDVIVGDHNGESCHPDISNIVCDFFSQSGYETALNYQFNGGDLLNHTKNPELGRHSLQIEFSKKLYLEENNITINAQKMARLQKDCRAFIEVLHHSLKQ